MRQRKAPATTEEQAPKEEKAKGTTAKQEETPTEKGGTKKLPLTERVKKFFDKVDPEINKNIHEISEQQVSDKEGNKNNCVMVVFTDKSNEKAGDLVVEEANITRIKDILFAYHTMTDDKKTAKVLDMSILAPEGDDDTHILVVQEF